LKGNRSEVLNAAGLQELSTEYSVSSTQFRAALESLASRTGRTAYCTAGDQGIFVARPGENPRLIPSYPVTGPIDIVGAGDSATSGIATARLSGADEYEAAAFGNLIASITIQQLGTTGTATPAQVRERFAQVS
jgi:sugar/nucleoside kinase (ribokinase family)